MASHAPSAVAVRPCQAVRRYHEHRYDKVQTGLCRAWIIRHRDVLSSTLISSPARGSVYSRTASKQSHLRFKQQLRCHAAVVLLPYRHTTRASLHAAVVHPPTVVRPPQPLHALHGFSHFTRTPTAQTSSVQTAVRVPCTLCRKPVRSKPPAPQWVPSRHHPRRTGTTNVPRMHHHRASTHDKKNRFRSFNALGPRKDAFPPAAQEQMQPPVRSAIPRPAFLRCLFASSSCTSRPSNRVLRPERPRQGRVRQHQPIAVRVQAGAHQLL